MSGFFEVCRGLSGFVEVCRTWGLHYALCVCACACVGVFVEVFRGLLGFVEPGGYMEPAFLIINCTLYLVNTAFCL